MKQLPRRVEGRGGAEHHGSPRGIYGPFIRSKPRDSQEETLKSSVKFGLLGAIVALTAAVGLLSGSFTGSVSAQPAPISVFKVCAAGAPGASTTGINQVTVGNQFTCAIALTATASVQTGSPITITEGGPGALTFSNVTIIGQDVQGTSAGTTAVPGVVTGNQIRIDCFNNIAGAVSPGAECDLGPANNCAGVAAIPGGLVPALLTANGFANNSAGNCVIYVQFTGTATTAGLLNETISIPGCTAADCNLTGAFGGATFAAIPVNGTLNIVGVAPAATTTISLAGCTAGLTPISPSFTGPGIGSAAAGSTITCRIDLDDNDPAPFSSELVGSGLVSFSVSSGTVTPTIVGLGATGSSSISGTTVTCGRVSNVPTDDTCDFVDVQIAIPAGATPGSNITLTVNYTPDNLAWNTPATATFTIGVLLQAALQPTGFAIACTAGTIGTLPAFLPGPIGGATVVAISTLPSSIACTVQTTVAGVPTAVANGTIEVSTVTGTLIDARGALSTNLRIPCTNTALTAPNNCTGVAFAVAGVGVGFVEVRVRYEPVPGLTNIDELEGSFVVAFVAPRPNLNLLLSPNPVSVGQDTTATLRLNRVVINCGVGIFCVDPTTGLPLLTNTSSILNGTVVFTIDNTAIARFQQAGVQPNVAGTTVGTAVIGTANQVAVRCGPLSSVVGSFESFFGGCDTASANIRALAAGIATVSAVFIPDLPGAVSSVALGGTPTAATIGNLTSFAGLGVPTDSRQLQVLDAPATGNITLVRGCNNVTPTVTESVSAFVARVMGTQVFAVWEHQAATNTFLGAPGPGAPAGAPADLTTVTRLRPVFVCVNGPGTLNQPAA